MYSHRTYFYPLSPRLPSCRPALHDPLPLRASMLEALGDCAISYITFDFEGSVRCLYCRPSPHGAQIYK